MVGDIQDVGAVGYARLLERGEYLSDLLIDERAEPVVTGPGQAHLGIVIKIVIAREAPFDRCLDRVSPRTLATIGGRHVDPLVRIKLAELLRRSEGVVRRHEGDEKNPRAIVQLARLFPQPGAGGLCHAAIIIGVVGLTPTDVARKVLVRTQCRRSGPQHGLGPALGPRRVHGQDLGVEAVRVVLRAIVELAYGDAGANSRHDPVAPGGDRAVVHLRARPVTMLVHMEPRRHGGARGHADR